MKVREVREVWEDYVDELTDQRVRNLLSIELVFDDGRTISFSPGDERVRGVKVGDEFELTHEGIKRVK